MIFFGDSSSSAKGFKSKVNSALDWLDKMKDKYNNWKVH